MTISSRLLALPLILCCAGVLAAAEPANPAIRPSFGWTLPETVTADEAAAGLTVVEVRPGGTAAALGIEPNDRIKSINGTPITSIEDVKAILAKAKIGEEVAVEFERGGALRSATGPLMERPRPPNLAGELNAAKGDLEALKKLAAEKAKEPSLAEILQSLKDIDQRLPKAVASFKKQYPNGDFDISIRIRITSDKNAKDVIELSNAVPPETATPSTEPVKPAEPETPPAPQP